MDFLKLSNLNPSIKYNARKPVDYTSGVDVASSMIDFSISNLRSMGVSYLYDESFLNKLRTYKTERPLRYQAWASRLMSCVDYLS